MFPVIKFWHPAQDTVLGIGRSPSEYDANSFLVHSFAGDDPTACREYVRERLGLAPFAANASRRLEGRGQRHDPRRSKNAVALFHASDSAKGTLVETYLASRGLYGPPPERIRFHGNLKHRSGATWPAMWHSSAMLLTMPLWASTAHSSRRTVLVRRKPSRKE